MGFNSGFKGLKPSSTLFLKRSDFRKCIAYEKVPGILPPVLLVKATFS